MLKRSKHKNAKTVQTQKFEGSKNTKKEIGQNKNVEMVKRQKL